MRYLALILCLLWPLSLAAQEDDEDRGFLVGLLESSLGGEGRTVRIDGFEGAFSSEATIEKISVADDDGVWLTLNDVAIGWTRSALLRGRIQIARLSASEIDIARAPLPGPDTGPAPEAAPFALPELPASLVIQEMDIARVALGEPVLGQAVALSLTGGAQLDGGAGDVNLQASRIDDKAAQFNIAGSFDNETRELMLDLDLSEAAGGLLSGLMKIPDQPSLELKVAGGGPLSNLQATLDLRTDDTPRLNGTLGTVTAEDGPTDFDVDLRGDVTALFLTEYAEFFGPDVALTATGARDVDGALRLNDLNLSTRAMNLTGQVALAPDAWPTLLDVKGTIENPTGEAVLLPATGEPVRINRADIQVSFDAANGDALNANLTIAGLDTSAAKAEQMVLSVDGTLRGGTDAPSTLAARVTFDGEGMDFDDSDTGRAVGTTIQGGLNVDYAQEQPLRLTDMTLSGAEWALDGTAEIDGETGATFETGLTAKDLSAFAGLAGVALVGEGTVKASGTASIGGFFDVVINGQTQDLGIGIAQVDTLLAGTTNLDLAARRNETGTFLDKLDLRNPALSTTATAALQSDGSQAEFDAQLSDVGMISPDLSGPLSIVGTAEQDDGVWTIRSDLAGPLDAVANLAATLDGKEADVKFTADLPDISKLVPQLTGATVIAANAVQSEGDWTFDASVDGPLDSDVRLDGTYAANILAAAYSLSVPDLSPVVPQISGGVDLTGKVQQLADGWQVDADINGPYESTADIDLMLDAASTVAMTYALDVPELSAIVPQVSGPLGLAGTVQQVATGWEVDADLTGPYQSSGDLALVLDAANTVALDYNLNLPDLSPVVPQVSGPLTVGGKVLQVTDGWKVNADIAGPYRSTGDLALVLDAANTVALDYNFKLPDLSPVVPQVTGPLGIEGNVQQLADGWKVNTDIAGPYSSTGDIAVVVDAANTIALDYNFNVPDVAPVVPQVSGPLGAGGRVVQIPTGWQMTADIAGPYDSTGDVDLALENELLGAKYRFELPNVGSIVSEIAGAAVMDGTVQQSTAGYQVDTKLDGPSGLGGTVSGLVGADGLLDLSAKLQTQLGLANAFIQPKSVIGTANIDLTVKGPPELSSVRAKVTTQGATLTTPTLPLSLNDISGSVELDGTQAIVAIRAVEEQGGAISINGPISLADGLPADLSIALESLTVTDSRLFETVLNGGLAINGPLQGGARISGQIDVGETNLQIPSGGASAGGAIPEIQHIGETRPVMRTRQNAGLVKPPEDPNASGPVFPIDLTINAPSRIFVRGRGLDAELGGSLRLSGTTEDMISTGQFDLIRGRLDVLAQRLNLSEGSISLQGRFEVFLLFVAETDTSLGTATISIEGPADDPQVKFESDPEAPEDEVLAQIFFGRSLSELSAFQALQLANAVAVLAGRGGESLLGKLRGSVGLDDLDVVTDSEGGTNLRAGKYLSENIYTDVTVGGDEGAEVSVNIDLTPKITVRGSVETETNNTTIGIIMKNDY